MAHPSLPFGPEGVQTGPQASGASPVAFAPDMSRALANLRSHRPVPRRPVASSFPPHRFRAARRGASFALAQELLMNLTISGHHLEVTPALREYVLTKLERVMRHFDQVVDVSVLLTVDKTKEKERRQRAEVTVHVKGRDIFVEQANEDLYAAIDQLMDKLDRQVVRHKDRVQDHHHTASKRIDASVG
jgi:putative sigma-54 modulation protein